MTTRLRFGSRLIDPATRELSHDGRSSTLSPRVFDCLAYLVEHRDRAVGRDELMAAVWGRADVSDSQLAQVMLKARRAVGDSGEAQRVIRTVAGFGYHWIAPVEPFGVDANVPGTVERNAAPGTGRAPMRRRVTWMAWVLLLACGMLLFAGWRARDEARAPSPVAGSASPLQAAGIAVLPADVDAAADWSWLRLGAMAFVATRLQAGGHLVVPSENVVSVMRGEDSAGTLPASVRRALDARRLVHPRVRRVDA
ncbi:MAG TPA: winged helix-turn-helix domain-containing protein, partial [Dokdonella sp.]